MSYNRKFFAVLFGITICFLTVTAFNQRTAAPGGDIEGYVFPKDAKPRVEIILPHPKKAGDTIHKSAVPNAAGFFKLNNVPEGTYTLLYFPKEAAMYRSASRTVEVVNAKTVQAESVTLEKQ